MRILPSRDAEAKSFLAHLSVVHQRTELTVQQQPLEKSLKDYSRMMIPDVPGGRQDPAGWVIDRNEYVKHFKGTTYVAVGAIAKKVAMQEAQVFAVRKKKSGIEHLEVPPTHPLVELLESVNPLHTQFDLWWHMIAWRLMTGDSFWWKAFNGLDVPTELWPAPKRRGLSCGVICAICDVECGHR